jgi:hypothetical protein
MERHVRERAIEIGNLNLSRVKNVSLMKAKNS